MKTIKLILYYFFDFFSHSRCSVGLAVFPPVTGYAFTHFGAEAVPLLTVAVSALAAADFAAMMAAARSNDFFWQF